MKLPGKIIVPILVLVIGGAIAYISVRRISLLEPGLEGPKVGEQIPPLPLESVDEQLPPPAFPIPGEECLLILLRGYAGYVDTACVEQLQQLAAKTMPAQRRTIVILYPGSDPGREYALFTAQLERVGVDPTAFTTALDRELHAVGALDSYGDPALPSAWHVDEDGIVIRRAYGTANDRTPLAPVIDGFLTRAEQASLPPSERWLQTVDASASVRLAAELVDVAQLPPATNENRAAVLANEFPPQFLEAPFDDVDRQAWEHARYFHDLANKLVAGVPESQQIRILFDAVVERLADHDPEVDQVRWPRTIWESRGGLCDRQAWVLCELAYQLGYETQMVYLEDGSGADSPHTICEIRNHSGAVWTADPLSDQLLPNVAVADLAAEPQLAASTWPDKPEWQQALSHCHFWQPSFPQDYAPRNQALQRQLQGALGDQCPRFGESPHQRLQRYRKLAGDQPPTFRFGHWFYPFRLLRQQLALSQP